MLDYTTLRVIWWLLLGIVLIGFAIMDGFDFGAMAIMPLVARNNDERRIMINSVAPTWEGNQVWLILGGGAIFAAWPYLYAASFSGFYIAMFIVLTALIFRPVSFKYRSKLPSVAWQNTCDTLLVLSGIIPCVIFGVAVGNTLQGVPFYFDQDLRFFYTGTFWALLNPFGLFCGIISLLMLAAHGAIYICNKTTDILAKRAARVAIYAYAIVIVLFAIGGAWIAHQNGYQLMQIVASDAPSNPLHKTASPEIGAWLSNYTQYPFTALAPILGFLGAALSILLVGIEFYKTAMVTSAIALTGIIATVGVSMFPFLLPSSSNPSQSLLVWDASSSQLTLWIMLIVGIIFLPIILAYTTWVYRIMRGKVSINDIHENSHDYY